MESASVSAGKTSTFALKVIVFDSFSFKGYVAAG